MTRSRTLLALVVVTTTALAVTALGACAATTPPRPARETGGPAPTACTSAEVLFLHNQ